MACINCRRKKLKVHHRIILLHVLRSDFFSDPSAANQMKYRGTVLVALRPVFLANMSQYQQIQHQIPPARSGWLALLLTLQFTAFFPPRCNGRQRPFILQPTIISSQAIRGLNLVISSKDSARFGILKRLRERKVKEFVTFSVGMLGDLVFLYFL
jgi:hypothetical protein